MTERREPKCHVEHNAFGLFHSDVYLNIIDSISFYKAFRCVYVYHANCKDI